MTLPIKSRKMKLRPTRLRTTLLPASGSLSNAKTEEDDTLEVEKINMKGKERTHMQTSKNAEIQADWIDSSESSELSDSP